jgi:hypothetical protein
MQWMAIPIAIGSIHCFGQFVKLRTYGGGFSWIEFVFIRELRSMDKNYIFVSSSKRLRNVEIESFSDSLANLSDSIESTC